MVYRVVTRWKKLNVRVQPGLGYRVVHQLERGALVTVYETVRNEQGTWHRVEQGWATGLYLERVRMPRVRRPDSPQQLPEFLEFDPVREARARQRLARLRTEREYAEERFVTYSQVAAQHGSRLYEMDEASQRSQDIQDVARVFGGAPTPGVTALELGHNLRLAREMEEEAAHWQGEMRRLDGEIERARRATRADD